jgi:8-oxo-dGTP pyrophosphatase MutT (NUDIX family)
MSAEERRFEKIGSETIYEGRIVTLAIERFRFADGAEVEREVIHHDGAAAIVAHDDTHVYLVRQPRELLGEPDFLEIPAGRLDEEGESPLEAAQRELAEEVGKAAADWRELKRFYTSPGFAQEEVTVFLATGLRDESSDAGDEERIEIIPWALAEIDGAIEACRDAKSLVGLLLLKELLDT